MVGLHSVYLLYHLVAVSMCAVYLPCASMLRALLTVKMQGSEAVPCSHQACRSAVAHDLHDQCMLRLAIPGNHSNQALMTSLHTCNYRPSLKPPCAALQHAPETVCETDMPSTTPHGVPDSAASACTAHEA